MSGILEQIVERNRPALEERKRAVKKCTEHIAFKRISNCRCAQRENCKVFEVAEPEARKQLHKPKMQPREQACALECFCVS